MEDLIFNIMNISLIIAVWVAIVSLVYNGYVIYKESDYIGIRKIDQITRKLNDIENRLKQLENDTH
jgi:hypothetical protein